MAGSLFVGKGSLGLKFEFEEALLLERAHSD